MKSLLQNGASFVAVLFILLLIGDRTLAQEDATPKKKLRNPAIVNGRIGGESHDSYVIYAPKGRLMTVEISWTPEDGNNASFTISESSNFFSSSPIGFGKESEDGKRWVGRIPKTRNYYIYVVAHPVADYRLKVRLR